MISASLRAAISSTRPMYRSATFSSWSPPRRAGAAGANGEDLLGEGVQALLHLGLGVPDVGLDHSGGPTSVPIGLPATTPSRLPPCDRSKTMIGILFSRQRVTAV